MQSLILRLGDLWFQRLFSTMKKGYTPKTSVFFFSKEHYKLKHKARQYSKELFWISTLKVLIPSRIPQLVLVTVFKSAFWKTEFAYSRVNCEFMNDRQYLPKNRTLAVYLW